MNKKSNASTTTAYDYDSIPEGYYDTIFRGKKGMQSKWHHLKFARVAQEIPENAAHLDIACGPGTFISTLPGSIQSTGVDIALPQIEYARKHYAAKNKKFETMQPGKLSFPDESLDIVTSIDLIEHIPEEESRQLLKECARVLKKSGILVVTTPNYASAWPVLEWIVNRVTSVTYEDQYITKFKKTRLHKHLEETNLKVVDVAGFMLSAPFYAALSWKLSDWVNANESVIITRKLGNILLGIARKI